MPKYEKWLGVGLGWVVGGPVGGILGFITGTMMEKGEKSEANSVASNMSDFEVNLVVLAAHLIKIDGRIMPEEVAFTENFLDTHFDEKHAAERRKVLNHCLTKEYDLNVVCDQLRMYAAQPTRIQVVRFLFDLAMSDGDLNEREHYFIFKLAGYLNVNDVEFRRIKTEHTEVTTTLTYYEILEVKRDAGIAEIRTAYRRLALKYHPDRNKDANETDRKKLAQKFQMIQEAYEKLKAERE